MSLRILGTDTGDAAPSLFFFTDQHRYIWNAGEGFARFCNASKTRLGRVEHIFLTSLGTLASSGLPGLILLLQSMDHSGFTLNGPPGLGTMIQVLRPLLRRRFGRTPIREYPFTQPALKTPQPVLVHRDDVASFIALPLLPDDARGTFPCDLDALLPSPAPPRPFPAALPVSEELLTLGMSQELNHMLPQVLEARDASQQLARIPLQKKKLDVPPLYHSRSPASRRLLARYVLHLRDRIAERARGLPSIVSLPPLPSPAPAQAPESTSALGPQGAALCYIVQCNDRPGKWNGPLCAELGLSGAQRGQLARGKHVTLDDGRVVRPEDVIGAAQPMPHFAVVDCPTVRHLASLLESPAFAPYQRPAAPMEASTDAPPPLELSRMFHFGPAAVLCDPRYADWAASFGPACLHVVCGEHAPQDAPVVPTVNQHNLLSHLDPAIYPPVPQCVDAARSAALPPPLPALPRTQVLLARPGMSFPLAGPPSAVDASLVPETLPSPALLAQAPPSFRPFLPPPSDMPPEPVPPRPRGACDVTFLGTAASSQTKFRNTSGILLDCRAAGTTPAHGDAASVEQATEQLARTTLSQQGATVILDAGEGTYGQMRRKHGLAETDAILASLRLVFISHHHGDHLLGLWRLLVERTRSLARLGVPRAAWPPLMVLGHWAAFAWLAVLNYFEPFECIFVDNAWATAPIAAFLPRLEPPDAPPPCASVVAQCIRDLNLVQLQVVPVIHRPAYSCAIVLDSEAGWRLSYSGDTLLCDAFIAAAADSTVMIHEATFDDSLHEEAAWRCHSTTSDALEAALRTRSRCTLLTHFSQRYVKLPTLLSSPELEGHSVAERMHAFLRSEHSEGPAPDVFIASDWLTLRIDPATPESAQEQVSPFPAPAPRGGGLSRLIAAVLASAFGDDDDDDTKKDGKARSRSPPAVCPGKKAATKLPPKQ